MICYYSEEQRSILFSRWYYTYVDTLHLDSSEVRIEGLETLDYLDNLSQRERFTEQGDAITFESEVPFLCIDIHATRICGVYLSISAIWDQFIESKYATIIFWLHGYSLGLHPWICTHQLVIVKSSLSLLYCSSLYWLLLVSYVQVALTCCPVVVGILLRFNWYLPSGNLQQSWIGPTDEVWVVSQFFCWDEGSKGGVWN